MTKKITFVDGDDWNAIYLDDSILSQSHDRLNYSAELLIKELGLVYEKLEADGDWLFEAGEFPENLKDVVTL